MSTLPWLLSREVLQAVVRLSQDIGGSFLGFPRCYETNAVTFDEISVSRGVKYEDGHLQWCWHHTMSTLSQHLMPRPESRWNGVKMELK